MKTDINIAAHFASVTGQERAKTRIINAISAVQNGGEAKSKFVTGRTGLGKTHFTDCIAKAYESLGFRLHDFACPSEITGKPYAVLSEDFDSGVPVVVRIGEAHRLKMARVQLARLRQFIMLATDERNKGKEISINDGELRAVVDWRKMVFILDTNFPGKLEEGKQSTSFRDRFLFETLDDLSAEEISEILGNMLQKKNLSLHPETLGMIVNCARGTARPLQNITDELCAMRDATGEKKTLNRKEVIASIRLAKLYPRGLTSEEVQILLHCGTPKRETDIASLFPNLEPIDLRKSLAYLRTCHRAKDGTSAGFVERLTGGIKTSAIGARYLATIKEEGFRF